MTTGHLALSEKEKHTLRLLLAGHDAKSMARHLNLSVHTVNERLRDARRKLSTSSSREAARLLHEAEAADPQLLVDETLRDAAATPPGAQPPASTAGPPSRHCAVLMMGVLAMLSLALTFLLASPQLPAADTPAPPPAAPPPAAPVETAAVQAARHWLEMGDASDWKGSWAATGTTFRSVNTLALWTSVSQKVRVPLGAVVSRELVSADEVPTPPNGNIVVKFRTRFANKADAVETIALTREGGSWKVVGCYLE